MPREENFAENKLSFPEIKDSLNSGDISVDFEKIFRVHTIRNLTESTYILRFDRNDMKFVPGQHITLRLPGNNQVREYSIYSPDSEPYLEVLIREVENGFLSKKLRKLKRGDLLNVEGPFGYFSIDNDKRENGKFLFIASGTGIAPFHSMTGSYQGLYYKILHGVRYANEAYERNFYLPGKYLLCASRDEGDFNGRVTDYLKSHLPDPQTLIYLCGNCDMINDVYYLLTSRGISYNQFRTEVYF
jgi:ferredoxin/flavodoxin---NADP+ reductase